MTLTELPPSPSCRTEWRWLLSQNLESGAAVGILLMVETRGGSQLCVLSRASKVSPLWEVGTRSVQDRKFGRGGLSCLILSHFPLPSLPDRDTCTHTCSLLYHIHSADKYLVPLHCLFFLSAKLLHLQNYKIDSKRPHAVCGPVLLLWSVLMYMVLYTLYFRKANYCGMVFNFLACFCCNRPYLSLRDL